MSDAGDDLALIREAAREAGALSLAMRDAGLKIWSKDGGSPVTDADLAVDAMLKARLGSARPDYGWLSEETADDPARLGKSRLFVVDPIDGTAAYLKGRPWFAVSIAVVENGRPVAGALYAPALDEMFEAAAGGGARMNGSAIAPSRAEVLEDCAMLGDAKMFVHPAWPRPWPAMRVESRNSVAYRMALVAAGVFDAALALSPKNEWDLAAADLICREAGATAVDHLGRPFGYNRPVPRAPSVVCAAPALAPLILERVRHIELPN
ncbi:3'(2'),5'-bisphosphate nucleotidase CysQ [Caulobacter sp. CCUG 60055]|uniref:3'(2'),5'-bisphosphate nucleotidase CysQ n=1 Tax=Caulobacter sp. CCUG 60055 TaxID=2100090 RepID=UPI001FA737E4|nr:3'(2'),5'-bisphosphate nucleotidase CysQ [Caulobacter sp. CCUG 60055]MBQ1542400.1 3'(2'),5'-bisphosphate nucleotidase CysQ [Caulobacteraceae bacterium]MCI3181020.1 3'(2'),5'-bisphosphate nucleotidase CysQ [Caulobacter sp. CCUG 60055]